MKYLTILVLAICLILFYVPFNQDTIVIKNNEYSFPDVLESTVEIRTYNTLSANKVGIFDPQPLTQMVCIGSGVMVEPSGYIITNNHVVAEGNLFLVKLKNGMEVQATLIGKDKNVDIGVLQIPKELCKPIKVGDSSKVKNGDEVFAFGSPFGLRQTITSGIISTRRIAKLNEEEIEYFQTDTPINHGNSGGPLVNKNGELIGINNWIFSNTGSHVGIAFSIPSNLVMVSYKSILDKDRGLAWIGVVLNGNIVLSVIGGSPADKAGISAGDKLISFNGIPIESRLHLKIMLAHAFPNYELSFRTSKGLKILQKEPERPSVAKKISYLEREYTARTTNESVQLFQEIASELRCPFHKENELLHCHCTASKSDLVSLLKMITSGYSLRYINMEMSAPINLTVWLDLSNADSLNQYKIAHEMKQRFGILVRIQIRHLPFDGVCNDEWKKKVDIFETLRSVGKEQELLDNLCMGLNFEQAYEKVGKITEKNFDSQYFKDLSEAQFNSKPFIQINKGGTDLNEDELKAYLYNLLLELSI